MTEDQYKTISAPSLGEFKDRGSKFLAYAYPAYSESDWQQQLEAVKKLHPKARHHCYAFRLGLEGLQYRANDDGEPSGSAGRPILGQIDSFGLTNLFVVVVRYFGGTKLGIPGLINAYKSSTIDALNQAAIIKKTVEDVYRIAFDYAIMSDVMNAVKKLNSTIVQQVFEESAFLDIAIPKSEVDEHLLFLRAKIAKVSVDEMRNRKIVIPGLKIRLLEKD